MFLIVLRLPGYLIPSAVEQQEATIGPQEGGSITEVNGTLENEMRNWYFKTALT